MSAKAPSEKTVHLKQINKAIEIYTKEQKRGMTHSKRSIGTRHPSSAEQKLMLENISTTEPIAKRRQCRLRSYREILKLFLVI
jgi:hypothetical protein